MIDYLIEITHEPISLDKLKELGLKGFEFVSSIRDPKIGYDGAYINYFKKVSK